MAKKKMKADLSGKDIEEVLAEARKRFGEDIIMRYVDNSSMNVSAISSGSLSIDIALGVGGYARGRIVEIYGPEASGKTTLTLHAIASCQKQGGTVAFLDVEHALDPKYAGNLGVDMGSVYLSQPASGEQTLDLAEMLVSSGKFDMVVVDSVAALVPQAELDGEMGDHHVGLQARLMSQALRKLTAKVSENDCILIFINQIRSKIGVVYGSNETTTGGNALKFYASQRLDIRRSETLKQSDETIIGHRAKVKIAKNKVAPPFKVAEFDVLFGAGVNYVGEVFDYSVTLGFVEKAGAWYSYNGEKIGQGRINALDYLREHEDVLFVLDQNVRKHYGLPVPSQG